MKKITIIALLLVLVPIAAMAESFFKDSDNGYSAKAHALLGPNFHMTKELTFRIFGASSIDYYRSMDSYSLITLGEEDYKGCQIDVLGRARITKEIPLIQRYWNQGQWKIYFEESLVLCNANEFPSKKMTLLYHPSSYENLFGVHAMIYNMEIIDTNPGQLLAAMEYE